MIGPDTRNITANFGPICTANGPNVTQPNYGTITVNLPAPNCNDPSTGTSGYIVNTPGTATLVDSVGKTVQVISSCYGSLNGRMQRIDETAWLPEKPIFFDGWRGDTGSWTESAAVITTDAAGVQHTSHTISFRIGNTPINIGAAYGGCAVLTTKVLGDTSDGTPGTITMNTPSNCPVGAGTASSRWYKLGTTVSLSTTKTGDKLKFLAWGGFTPDHRPLVRHHRRLHDQRAT